MEREDGHPGHSILQEHLFVKEEPPKYGLSIQVQVSFIYVALKSAEVMAGGANGNRGLSSRQGLSGHPVLCNRHAKSEKKKKSRRYVRK